MDKRTIIIIVFGIIILSLAGIMVSGYIQKEAYDIGFQHATLIINQQILNSLQQNGYVPFVFMENNQIYNIKLISQNE